MLRSIGGAFRRLLSWVWTKIIILFRGVDEYSNPFLRFFRKISPLIVFVGVSGLILLDLRYPEKIDIYWELVALIVIVAVSPFVPFISKLRYRDAEVEFDTPSRDDQKAEIGATPQFGGESSQFESEDLGQW